MRVRDEFQTGRAARWRGLHFGRRGAVAAPWIAAILFFACGALAQTTNDLSAAEIQGRNLAARLCAAAPEQNFKLNGVLQIHAGKIYKKVSVTSATVVSAETWQTIYAATRDSGEIEKLIVTHSKTGPNRYACGSAAATATPDLREISDGQAATNAFAGSDFSLADLGLEFFHWPGQKILKHEMRRSRACQVLESTNPVSSPNGYSRVVAWIDNENSGIVQAEAYDGHGRLLKEFEPKSLKKVNGHWEIQVMEISNRQTGSRTRMEFE